MNLLIQILLYTLRFSGFFVYLYGAYQFIEVELSKTYDKRKDKQLEEHIGKDINVRLFKPIDKQKELTGTLQKFDDEQVVLLINEEEITINRENISSMKRAYKW